MALFVSDGQPDRSVRLCSDGPRAARGARLHPQHGQTDQEGRLQCATDSEVHPQVSVLTILTTQIAYETVKQQLKWTGVQIATKMSYMDVQIDIKKRGSD